MGQTEAATVEIGRIAAEMQMELMRKADHGRMWVNRLLPHGLQLVLERQGEGYRLALARAGVYPSQAEVDLCIAAFCIPERRTTSSKSAYVAGSLLHVTELAWRDMDGR